MGTNFGTNDFDNAGLGSITSHDGNGNFASRNGDTRDIPSREYGREGYGNSNSSTHENSKNSDINISAGIMKNEGSKEINSGKILSSLIGIGVSGFEIASIVAGGGVVETVTIGAGLSLIGSAFAFPALILSGVGLAYALSGEQNDDIYDGFDLATNPLMLIGYISSDVDGKDKKSSFQNAKYVSTFSKVMNAKGSMSSKELSKQYGVGISIFKNIDATQSTMETKDDIGKIRMSNLP